MRRIYKICIIIAIFIASSSVALAGFNYNSINNYFLFESALNLSGGSNSYVLVGNGLIGLPNSLSVSNNLIFMDRDDPGGSLTESGNVTRAVNKKVFNTPAINLIPNSEKPNSDIDLVISTIGGSGELTFTALGKIIMNQNFVVPKGLYINPLTPQSAISPGTIYVTKVLADRLNPLSADKILIPIETLLYVNPSSSVSADSITFDDKAFCEVKQWTVEADQNRANAELMKTEAQAGGEEVDCDPNYFVYDLDATAGKMVCCRFAENLPPDLAL